MIRALTQPICTFIFISLFLLSGCENSVETAPVSLNDSSEISKSTNPLVIQGRVTFDQIPHSSSGGLLPDQAYPAPARYLKMEMLNASGEIIDTTSTTETGEFAFFIPTQTEFLIRARAQIENPNNNLWSARIVDNTDGNAVYALDSGFIAVEENVFLEMHATAGFGAEHFYDTRSAGPFAILDALVDGFEFISDQYQQPLPELDIAWSVNNITAAGDVEDGHIGSSYYSKFYGKPTIFLLGAINNDADDYDRSVILHEFGHFVMDQISRGDSIGGSYNPSSKLDLRVSFNEAIANVFSGLINNDAAYVDSFYYQDVSGSYLANAQTFNLERNQTEDGGWYSPATLSWLLYDLADEPSNDDDGLALGWPQFYRTLTAQQFTEFDGAASIYSLLDTYINLYPQMQNQILDLSEQHDIHFFDAYGNGETNDGGFAQALPLYQFYEGSELELCSNSQASDFNGADVRNLVQFTQFEEGPVTIKVANADPTTLTNPEFTLYNKGQFVLAKYSAPQLLPDLSDGDQPINSESITQVLQPGSYLLEVFDRDNADNVANNGGLRCFNVSIENGGLNEAPNSSACNNLASLLGDTNCLYDSSSADTIAF